MGDNVILSDIQLTRKCIVLVIATTAARFSEIAQFSTNESGSTELDSEWSFTVRVKNKEFKLPRTIHQRQHSEIDPVLATKELRTRISKRKRKEMKKDNSFWYTERWNVMTVAEIRDAAKQLLQQAGIEENRPYHLKHAAITWLRKQRISSDDIVRFGRYAPGSTTYLDFYLSEDFGKTCGETMERTAFNEKDSSLEESDQTQQRRQPTKRRKVRRRSL
jgi:hypothetical protein